MSSQYFEDSILLTCLFETVIDEENQPPFPATVDRTRHILHSVFWKSGLAIFWSEYARS